MYNPETEAWIKGHMASTNPADRAAVNKLNTKSNASGVWNQYRPGNYSNPRTGLEPGSKTPPGGGRYSSSAMNMLKGKARTPSKYEAPKPVSKNAAPKYDMGKHVGAKIFAANREMTAKQRAVARAAYEQKQRKRNR